MELITGELAKTIAAVSGQTIRTITVFEKVGFVEIDILCDEGTFRIMASPKVKRVPEWFVEWVPKKT